jgi:concanavalin A-like lectin/glucanase superfamily protein
MMSSRTRKQSGRAHVSLYVRARTVPLSVLTGLVGLMLAPAAGIAGSQVRMGPAAGAPGTFVVLDGTGFPASRPVRVGLAGHRSRPVRASSAGTYHARVTVPARRRGWVTIVSRSGRTRVVNRYFATGPAGAPLVVEFASPNGRLRVVSTDLVPGAALRMQGMGFAARERLRISWVGLRPTVRSDRRGRFAAALTVPPGATPGSWPFRLVGARARIAFRLDIHAPAPPPPPAPAAPAPAAPPPPPPAPTPLSPNLVALWHMDETSGTVMRDSVGGHNGRLSGVALGAPGFAGTAYRFNGSAFVSVPSAAALNPGSKNITITIRMNTTSVPATPDWDLIRKGLFTSAGGEYKIEYQPSGKATCGFVGSTGTTRELTAGPALNDGRWHTVQCTKTASSIVLVVDGQPFTMAGAVGSISNSAAMAVGARPDSEFFQGLLDEASVSVG